MQINSKVLMVIALVSAVVASIVIVRLPMVSSVQVCIVSGDLGPGTPLIAAGQSANMTSGTSTLGELLSSGLIPATLISAFDGRRVSRRIASGTPLSLNHLIAPSRKTADASNTAEDAPEAQDVYFMLSRQLSENECAIAIPASDLSTLGDALEPGDIVDVLTPGMSVEPTQARVDSLAPPFAIRNLKVLAVGGRTQDGWVSAPRPDEGSGTLILAVPKVLSFRTAQLFSDENAKPQVILHPRESKN